MENQFQTPVPPEVPSTKTVFTGIAVLLPLFLIFAGLYFGNFNP
jgi:hypothetical protein